MADRIVVMHDGNVEQIGTPLQLYDQPANLFVAGFIGSPAMNLFRGTLRREDGRVWVVTPDNLVLEADRGVGGSDRQAVVYGIRPGHLSLASDAAQGLPAEVEVVEPTGDNTLVYCKVGGTLACAATTDRHPHHPGERLWLVPKPDAGHVFDAASGQRL